MAIWKILCIQIAVPKDFSQESFFWREFFWPKNAYLRNEQNLKLKKYDPS